MGYHPIESLMKTTMDSLKDMVDVNTVVGEPVETKEGTVIIPVSRVSFGFVTGGGDDNVLCEGGQGDSGQGGRGQGDEGSGGQGGYAMMPSGSLPFTGGAGAGVSVRPVGFLIVGERRVKFLPVDSRALVDRLLEEAPELLDGLVGWFDHRNDDEGPDKREDPDEREERDERVGRRRGRREE